MLRLGSFAVSGVLAASLTLLASCVGEGISDNSINASRLSHSVGLWSPSGLATCSKADHDRYLVSGPDGKLYPTWHPAVDPEKGCSYGHDHGRDPHGSALYSGLGGVPFGVASEALDTWDAHHPRPEDHDGQKIMWENGVMLQQVVDGHRVDIGVRCNFLMKAYQNGPLSPDAGVHELMYHVECDDGTEIHATTLARSDQPVSLGTADGAQLAWFDPRVSVIEPGRRLDPGANPAEMLMELCDMQDLSSDEAHSGGCQAFPNFGHRRLVYFNQTDLYNGGGPSIWYTDPFGAHGSKVPFPGSVRQFIAPVTNDRGFRLAGQVFGGETAHTSQYLK